MFDLRRILLNLIPMLLSLSVHEFAHALVADRLGDGTPRAQGRLTLSPLAHYDVLGTFVVPMVATLTGGYALIGWARPVEFRPANLTRRLTMRQGAGVVALAGPASNLLLAVAAAGLVTLLSRSHAGWLDETGMGELLNVLLIVNLGLCVFNLLPLPPLDGSHLLPRRFDSLKETVAPYSFLLILILLNIGVIREYLFTLPVRVLSRLVVGLFDLNV